MIFKLLLLATLSQAAPAPEFLIINYEKAQCMRYWAGDEFHTNAFPEGKWERYMAYGEVKTKLGSCTFKAGKDDFKNCCEKLGLKFIVPNHTR